MLLEQSTPKTELCSDYITGAYMYIMLPVIGHPDTFSLLLFIVDIVAGKRQGSPCGSFTG